jgi:hydrogenase nickel incorporation protein HypA/HybF
MHELSVTESILEITLRHAQQAQARRVTALHLVIGQLASIVDDSVQFYWDIMTKDTLADGAVLHFRRIPAELECSACSTRYTLPADDLACPSCHSSQVKVVSGSEFYLDSIEIE